MSFPLGKPIVGMAVVAMICGGWLGLHPAALPARRNLWVFDAAQYEDYRQMLRGDFERELGSSIAVQWIPARAMDMRLPILFMSPGKANEVPDAVEVPIGSIALYLRPPTRDIGFLPLNRYLETNGQRTITTLDAPGQAGWNARYTGDDRIYTFDGRHWNLNPRRTRPDAWIDRLLPSRLASATKEGEIFGLPHDVHPVALAYRDDLFRAAGVALADGQNRPLVHTWPAFQDRCLAFEDYWRGKGVRTRHAIEMPRNNSGMLSILLAQRRVELIGPDQSIHINDAKVAQTLAFYVTMVAGPGQIAGESQPDTALEYKDFADGNLCAVLMPDWKVTEFRIHLPELAGKWRMIPLPRFEPDDAPTASYGGSLMCIPRAAADPDAAWRIVEHLYLSPAAMADHRRLGILPPLPEEWDKPQWQEPDEYFGGQKSLALYADLARQAPPARQTPADTMAMLMLSYVQSRAVGYLRDHGPDGLEAYCQQMLDLAAADLRRRIAHARFEP